MSEKIVCCYSGKSVEGMAEMNRAIGKPRSQQKALWNMREAIVLSHEHMGGHVAATIFRFSEKGVAIIRTTQSWECGQRNWSFDQFATTAHGANPIIVQGLIDLQDEMFDASTHTSGAAACRIQKANDYIRDVIGLAGPALVRCTASDEFSTLIVDLIRREMITVLKGELESWEALVYVRSLLDRAKRITRRA